MTLLVVVLGILILGATAALLLVLLFAGSDSEVPEAAEAPDPVDEHFTTARIVAGEDLDKDKRAIVNLALAAMLDADPGLAELDSLDSLSAYYVTPEGER